MAKDPEKLKNLTHRCYLITNLFNNKVYVGTTYKDIVVRFHEHIKVSNYTDDNKKQAVHRAISKYGVNSFKVEILSEYGDAASAYAAEIEYIKQYKSNNKKYGYNQSEGGDRGPLMVRYDRGVVIGILSDFCNNMLIADISAKYAIPYHSVFDITRLRISDTHNLPAELLDKLQKVKERSKKRKRVLPSEVVFIINDFVNGRNIQELSDKYQLSINNVWNIIHRNTWRNVRVGTELETLLETKLSDKKYWRKSKKHDKEKDSS